jgi:hypothetical protein
VATTPKPRVVKLEILPEGEKAIASGNTKHKTVRYVVKVKIGGVAGLVAPLLGKQPPDMHMWVLALTPNTPHPLLSVLRNPQDGMTYPDRPD